LFIISQKLSPAKITNFSMQKKKKTKKGAKQLLYALNEGDLKEEF